MDASSVTQASTNGEIKLSVAAFLGTTWLKHLTIAYHVIRNAKHANLHPLNAHHVMTLRIGILLIEGVIA